MNNEPCAELTLCKFNLHRSNSVRGRIYRQALVSPEASPEARGGDLAIYRTRRDTEVNDDREIQASGTTFAWSHWWLHTKLTGRTAIVI